MADSPRTRRRRSSGLSLAMKSDNEEPSGAPNDSIDNDMPGTPEEVDAPPNASEEEDSFTPENRLAEVNLKGNSVAKEYRLRLIYRSLIRGVPLDQIAQQLNLSVSQVSKDRAELKKRLAEEAKNIDSNQMIGDAMAFFQEIGSVALRIASSTKTHSNTRLAALRTALSAKNDLHRLFQASGVFEVMKYQKSADNEAASDMEQMVEMTKALLNADVDEEGNLNLDDQFSMANSGLLDEEEEQISLTL
jgi:hypothetical protein